MTRQQPRYRDGELLVRDGLKIHYRDYMGSPERPPLLCLHGLTRNSGDFADFAERYSPRFRVIAPDFRGRGRSDYDPLPSRYNPLTYASDVLQLLDDLGLERAIFVGTSLGGLVTMTMAAMAPSRIAASILNDIGPELSPAGLDRIMTYLGKDVRFKTWDEAAEAIADNHQRLPASFTHRDWLKMARRLCRRRGREIVYDYDMAIAVPFTTGGATPRVDLWPLFTALAQKPLLVVRAEHSDLLGAAATQKMRLAAPSARFAVVAGVGHPPMLDEPDATAAIDAFLDSLDQ
jgi:pimeloyl-ACP methyl ester carboxylesterase